MLPQFAYDFPISLLNGISPMKPTTHVGISQPKMPAITVHSAIKFPLIFKMLLLSILLHACCVYNYKNYFLNTKNKKISNSTLELLFYMVSNF